MGYVSQNNLTGHTDPNGRNEETSLRNESEGGEAKRREASPTCPPRQCRSGRALEAGLPVEMTLPSEERGMPVRGGATSDLDEIWWRTGEPSRGQAIAVSDRGRSTRRIGKGCPQAATFVWSAHAKNVTHHMIRQGQVNYA